MANHSSILAWETPRSEEPGGLQSMGSQRAGHDRVTEHAHVFIAVCGLSLVVANEGYSFVGCRLLIVVASVVAEHRLSSAGSVVWHTGLPAPQHAGSSRTRD